VFDPIAQVREITSRKAKNRACDSHCETKIFLLTGGQAGVSYGLISRSRTFGFRREHL
jgi:hypothetical protein